MKNILYTIIILISLIQGLFSQNSIKGTVLDENNKGIFFSTIALYQKDTKKLSKTASSDENGNFTITSINPGKYYMEISMLGYKKELIDNLEFPKDNNKSIKVAMKVDAQVLSTVEIKAKKPLLEQQSDRLVVNVADNITGINENLMDVMKKVPGVIVAGGKISLAGSSNLTILINGKTTKYMDVESLLKDMPGDNIKKVEIIHQPGAEFDAAGTGAIINIILKKNSLFGTSGTAKIGVGKGKFWKYNTGLTMSHYEGSVNINGGLGYRNGIYSEGITVDRKVIDDRYIQASESQYGSKSYRANLSVDWNISDKHRVGFQSRYVNYNSDNATENITEIIYGSDELQNLKIKTDNTEKGYWRLGSINPYYTFEIDTFGQKLELDLDYIQFGSNGKNLLIPTELTTNTHFPKLRYDKPGLTKITVGKIDYSYPVSKELKFQLGGKYSLADLDNDFQSRYSQDDDWLINTAQSNHFLFKETIKAAYSKMSFNNSVWSATLGLRYEDSNSNGMSVGIDTTLNRRIKKFFPSASIGREIIKGLMGTFSYSYRLDRPRYSTLNPFRYSLDSYTSQRGNPKLRAEFTHSMKFSLSYQKQPFFNVEYKISNDPMVQVIEQNDDTGEAFKSTVNLKSKNNLNISLFFPLSFIPKVSGYGGVIANRVKYDSPYLNEVFDESKWDYTTFINMNIPLPYDIETELSGWFTTGGLRGLISSESMYGVSFGISKKFLNKKAKVSFGVDNIFNKFYTGIVDYSNIDLTLKSRWDAPVANIQFSYKFGNQHIKSKKHRNAASEELRRAGKS